MIWARLFPKIGLLGMHLVDWNGLLSIKKIRVTVSLRNIVPLRCLIDGIVNLIGITMLPLIDLRKPLLAL